MKIATCTVSLEGLNKPSGNNRRLSLLAEVLEYVKRRRISLVCLPSGYLTASSNANRDSLIEKVVEVAKSHGVAIAVGIDVDQRRRSKRSIKKQSRKGSQYSLEKVRRGSLPWFAACWSPKENIVHCWRERSSNSNDQREISDAVCAEARTLPLGKYGVEVLMCGEVFNERIRNSVLSRRKGLIAAVDLGHYSDGFRVFAAMQVLARGRLNTLCSVHTKREKAMKYCYLSGGRKKSSRDVDAKFGPEPRIEVKVWNLLH